MKMIIVSKMHKAKFFIYVKKVMKNMSDGIFHDEEHRAEEIRHHLHEEHGQDQLTVEEMQSFEVDEQVQEQIQVADHDGKT